MSSICFVTVFDKTEFFFKIAHLIKRQQLVDVFWISTSPKWTNFLLKNGVSEDKILTLFRSELIETGKLYESTIWDEVEKSSEHKFRQVYFMDRILSRQDWTEVQYIFRGILEKVNDFLKKNKIKIVFGEGTAAHEIIISMLCRYRSIEYLNPHVARIPDGRLLFFKGHMQSDFIKVDGTNNDWLESDTLNVLETFLEKKEKPGYFYMQNREESYWHLSFLKKVTKKLVETLFESRHDISVKPFKHHLKYEQKVSRPIHRWVIKNHLNFQSMPSDKKYVLYTMHVQPEASIDVLGVDYNNQYETIKSIAVHLPSTHCLLVKEHPNALGLRSFSELRRIASIPGVVLISPDINTADLIKKVDLVCTVSGTVALEAALLGTPSVTFSPMYFNALPLCQFEQHPEFVFKHLSTQKRDEKVLKQDNFFALHSVLKHSFEGLVSDPISNPLCTSQKNIKLLARAFAAVLEKKVDEK